MAETICDLIALHASDPTAIVRTVRRCFERLRAAGTHLRTTSFTSSIMDTGMPQAIEGDMTIDILQGELHSGAFTYDGSHAYQGVNTQVVVTG